MALSLPEQTFELLKKNKSILVIFKEDWTGDELSSALALANVLRKLDKQVDVVCHDFKTKNNLDFLSLSQIKKDLGNLQKFIISINTAKTQIGEFYYDHGKEKLNIYIAPKSGQFNKDDITTAKSDYKYDLIIVVGSPDLESLGKIYDDNNEFFLAILSLVNLLR